MDEVLERRVTKCEDKIDAISKELAGNTVSMEFIKDIVDKFGKTQDETVKTLIKIQGGIDNLNDKHEGFEKKLCEIKEKVDGNEESHKIDTRSLFKKIIEKIFIGIGCAAIIGGIIYWTTTL